QEALPLACFRAEEGACLAALLCQREGDLRVPGGAPLILSLRRDQSQRPVEIGPGLRGFAAGIREQPQKVVLRLRKTPGPVGGERAGGIDVQEVVSAGTQHRKEPQGLVEALIGQEGIAAAIIEPPQLERAGGLPRWLEFAAGLGEAAHVAGQGLLY